MTEKITIEDGGSSIRFQPLAVQERISRMTTQFKKGDRVLPRYPSRHRAGIGTIMTDPHISQSGRTISWGVGVRHDDDPENAMDDEHGVWSAWATFNLIKVT